MDHAALDMDLEFSGIPLKGKTFAGILEEFSRTMIHDIYYTVRTRRECGIDDLNKETRTVW